MRPSVFLLPLLWLVACAAQADTPTPQLSAQQCGISTSYDVLADTGGIWLRRKQGAPREIFFHGGELNVDHRPQPVSDADAQRLRALEHGTRALMPAVTAIARSVVDLSFDALGGVVQMLTGSARQARKVERLRGTALAQVEGTLGRGRWEQELFDARFEASVEHAAEALAGSLTRSVLWTVVTGRPTRWNGAAPSWTPAWISSYAHAVRCWKPRRRRCAPRCRRCTHCNRRWTTASTASHCSCWK